MLRDALRQLTTEADTRFIAAAIQNIVEQYMMRGEIELPDISFDELPDDNWTSGVEEFRACTTEQLWGLLGLAKPKLPHFNTDHDSENIHDRWDKADAAWFADKANLVPFQPCWHQLVGILKMLKMAFEGKPILLMDEVGVGKTLQVVGVVAMLAYYRKFWNDEHDYPGMFCKCQVVVSLFTQSDKSLSRQKVPWRVRRNPRSPHPHCLPRVASGPVALRSAKVPPTAVVRPAPLYGDIDHKAGLLEGGDEGRGS